MPEPEPVEVLLLLPLLDVEPVLLPVAAVPVEVALTRTVLPPETVGTNVSDAEVNALT